ncbi:MAG: hypothetical protein B7Z55_04725, partial [Planctomycetales bacterium 12-60-4]
MSSPFVKLLHAASVQLDVPLRGVGKIPRDAVDQVAAATLTAWERLVDGAVMHGVDGVLLTGDTFDASADSLAADVALRQGLERLLEHEIPVFVIPGRLDPLAAWQQIPALPENVTVFDSPWDAAVDLTDNGRLIARLMPVSADTDVSPPELHRLQVQAKSARDAGSISVGLLWNADEIERDASGEKPASERRFASLNILCCDADAADETLPVTDGPVHRQTAPQGMGIDDVGPRGATLLQFDPQRQLTKRFIPLGPVRRERLSIRLEQARHRDELCEQMLAQLEEMPATPGEQLRLIRWSFLGSADARHRIGFDEAAAHEVLETLNGLTDQPGGLRYLHEPVPLWQDQTVTSELGELWRDYLEYFDERPPVTLEEL